MRAVLVYNPRAGEKNSAGEDNKKTSQATFVTALEAAGWTVSSCHTEDQLDRDALRDADAVVVAGGDGTVGRVAKQIAGGELPDIPMAILPVGTVNNVARSLGVGIEPMMAVSRLERAVERRIDLGIVTTAASKAYFLEGVSAGVLAHVLANKAGHEHKSPAKASGLIARVLETYEPRHYRIEADGRDLSGDYVLIAVMNIRSLGPGLRLAPRAEHDDGELDVVRVGPHFKRALIDALYDIDSPADIVLPSFEVSRATHVRIRSEVQWAQRDDKAWELDGDVTLDVARGALRMLVPRERDGA
ncbi:diacylglycerol/lipid kinase family protein [Pendulispora albinea]|uniref:DAGKc domain-containing protein n=1 Tax=Pendulispora albinea TaxID=2741071 RepID=A0ABZ2LTW8_9BACT